MRAMALSIPLADDLGTDTAAGGRQGIGGPSPFGGQICPRWVAFRAFGAFSATRVLRRKAMLAGRGCEIWLDDTLGLLTHGRLCVQVFEQTWPAKAYEAARSSCPVASGQRQPSGDSVCLRTLRHWLRQLQGVREDVICQPAAQNVRVGISYSVPTSTVGASRKSSRRPSPSAPPPVASRGAVIPPDDPGGVERRCAVCGPVPWLRRQTRSCRAGAACEGIPKSTSDLPSFQAEQASETSGTGPSAASARWCRSGMPAW